MQLVFDSKISLNCQFKYFEEYAVKQQWAHNLHTQNTYNLSSSDNTMPLRRKSPRKNQGMRPGYYGTTNQDSPVIARGKASAKPPAKKKRKIGYKELT